MQKKILALPGMGDLYWLFTKMEAFIEQEQLTEKPLIYTWELQPHKRSRSRDYIKRVPFVEYGGEYDAPNNKGPGAEFNSLYFGTEWKIAPFREFDYFLSMNGILRNGLSLDHGDLGKLKTNWFFELTPSPAPEQYTEVYGRYIIAYFTEGEMYDTWIKSLPLHKVYEILSSIATATGCTILLSGGKWDAPTAKRLMAMDKKNQLRDITGTTNIDQLFELMHQSEGMIGWAAGNTIMSTVLRKPTLVIWSNKYFRNEPFFVNGVPADGFQLWHDVAVVERDNSHAIISKMIKLLNYGK